MVKSIAPPAPRKLPRQGRSRLLVDAIVQACQKVLEEEGAEQLSTNRIAEVAGVTIGSLYQYFPNKEAILANLFSEKIAAETGRIGRESTERILAKMEISLEATIGELILVKSESLLRFYQLHGDFYREYWDFFDFHGQVDAMVINHYRQPSWQDWLQQLLRRYDVQYHVKRSDENSVDYIEQTSFIVSHIIDGLLEAALDERPEWLSDPAYLSRIKVAVLGFLIG